MRTIQVPPGIGDNVWILQKLINAGEKFYFRIPGGQPQRGKQVFDLLPMISGKAVYESGTTFTQVKARASNGNFFDIKDPDFALECNTHLEHGKRIEEYLPDLPTSYILPWISKDAWINHAAKLTPFYQETEYIGIFATSYKTTRAWKFWEESQWVEMMLLCGKQFTYVILGAQWDLDLSTNLVKLARSKGLKVVDTVGHCGIGTVLEIMKRLYMFIGFPSGLSILNETVVANQTIMFYPPHLEPMMNAWADPARIASGEYKGCQFCSPAQIYEWMREKNLVY